MLAQGQKIEFTVEQGPKGPQPKIKTRTAAGKAPFPFWWGEPVCDEGKGNKE